jgi:8-oxo-dGTP pyrophosphatase MutT (NUDIX family)
MRKMSETLIHLPDLSDKEGVIDRIVEGLGRVPIDYVERHEFIRGRNEAGDRWLAAGVILLLHYQEGTGQESGFVLQLIKRSSEVPQPGDLSCPGGMLHPSVDPFLARLMVPGLTPILQGKALSLAKARGRNTYESLSLFLTNALREAWEEIRLNPFNVRFLGPLPSRELYVFSRIIFPVVGLVNRSWRFQPNWEVERIVEIPLRALFERANYGTLTVEIETTLPFRHQVEPVRDFPCFFYTPPGGREEVLWGATMSIVMNFLEIVFGFTLPEKNSNRVVRKSLRPDYATGNHGTSSP